MKNTTLLAASVAVAAIGAASGAHAGGMDRSRQSIAPLFETGTYVELSFGSVSPDVSGAYPVMPGYELDAGDVTPSFNMVSGAYKRDFNDKLSFALIIDQPFGADVDYGASTSYPIAGSNATVKTTAVTAVLRYKFDDRFSVYGGLRHLTSEGEVSLYLSGTNFYQMETSTENDWGYLVGAAYEIPDIALRASLTYNSEIDIDFTADELSALGANSSDLAVTMPKSVNFDFQTGIAADTLLMFSARWAEWTTTTIAPDDYVTIIGDNLVDHSDDTISYSLGLGRRFNDKLSGSFSIGYEKSYGGISGNLSPTDGYKSVAAGLKYQITDQTAISGGVSYAWIGDTTTSVGGEFEDNSAIGFGLKLSHHF
ncbi:OmpP1/FadL family transporter [Celeribacter sp. SCSIO 80788]|jgi:long-subunit fatty acid transport protein|uniref:OmpP1/FadL family transporter n=1 Tax=Celeribacter sp. SCSIO 80788 TaxID=3117013 RepID=UPI003DA503E9